MKQILLSKKNGCSGRGVRLELLTRAARDAIFESAANEVGKDATMLELRRSEERAGLCAFVVEVTEKDGFNKPADLVGDVAWKKVSAEHLESKLDDYFTAKDSAALVAIFHKLHDVTQVEVDDILGEAQDVTAD